MLKVFYGGDRLAARKAIDMLFWSDYEGVEAENLERVDMDTIFYGTSIFGDKRKILVKDLSENKSCWEAIPKYIDTPHDVIIWNAVTDARTTTYKELKAAKVEMRAFQIVENKEEQFIAFNAMADALRGDTKAALLKCEKMELKSEPYLVIGAFTSEACKHLATSRKAREAIKILAKADMDMKSTGLDGWNVVKSAVVKISKL